MQCIAKGVVYSLCRKCWYLRAIISAIFFTSYYEKRKRTSLSVVGFTQKSRKSNYKNSGPFRNWKKGRFSATFAILGKNASIKSFFSLI